jgi:8-oxo-dGTP diphosphatase
MYFESGLNKDGFDMKEFGKKVKGIEYTKRPGSYGIIIKDGRIGVVKSSGYYTYFLVGGGVEEGEDETQTLRREAIEEIGFQLEVREKIGAAIEYLYVEEEKEYIAKECNFYRVLLADKTEEKGKHKLVWITKDRLDEMHHRSYQWIIEKELKQQFE